MTALRVLAAVSLTLSVAVSMTARAQTAASGADHTARHPSAAASAPASMSDGEVRKIDKAQGKVTLRHGPIQNLEMPGMTMVFKVADPKLLDGLKEGDKIRFAADRLDGAITVTAIEPAGR